jgi:hypothetical protein
MTAKGMRKCRAVDSEENQKQVSHRCSQALGNRSRDFHIPAAPATSLSISKQKNKKRKEINPSPKPCPSGSSQD